MQLADVANCVKCFSNYNNNKNLSQPLCINNRREIRLITFSVSLSIYLAGLDWTGLGWAGVVKLADQAWSSLALSSSYLSIRPRPVPGYLPTYICWLDSFGQRIYLAILRSNKKSFRSNAKIVDNKFQN